MKSLIRFDWAIKRLLRNKADFVVVEGFLSELLGNDIKIVQVLESEGNKTSEENKTNVVDILVQDAKDELIIIEVQNAYFPNYLMRMLFGISKVINDTTRQGDSYGKIKKVISVNIVYFDLGQGKDYVYHGSTRFMGIHEGDTLKLSPIEQAMYQTEDINKIYPEFYIIKVNDFDKVARNNLDEWVEFLKTETINADTKAKGLKEAYDRLNILKLSDQERKEYERYLTDCSDNYELIYGNFQRGKIEGKVEGIELGKMEGKMEDIINMSKEGMSISAMSRITGLAEEEVKKIIATS